MSSSINQIENFLPLHGGDIVAASERYGIPIDQWLDLSTGVNPEPYPVNGLPESAFHRLPYLQSDFFQTSADYYKSDKFLPVAGTQAVIQQLPLLLKKLPIIVPEVGYSEHVKHWKKMESVLNYYPSFDHAEACSSIDLKLAANPRQHLLVINPNNPTGLSFSVAQLFKWADQLAADAYLIIDEAFIDLMPEASVLNESLPENIIVLRSFGKFFGLAGIRLGFVFANQHLLQGMRESLGLWQVNGPAQSLAIEAFRDSAWQGSARQSIRANAQFTQSLFASLLRTIENGWSIDAGLFCSYRMPLKQAHHIGERFAGEGVLLRVIPIGSGEALLRVGLLSKHDKKGQGRIEAIITSLS